jgi:hypothetical protein
MGGSGQINVSGGNVFSNGCLRENGDPSVSVTGGVPAGHDLFSLDPPNEDNWDPQPVVTTTLIIPEEYTIDPPNCASGASHHITGNSITNNFTFDPGLTCITGNVTIGSNATIRGSGITIVMQDGMFVINGGADVQITAPTIDSNPAPAVEGLLIYLPASNANPVKLNGNQDSIISGLIYAPKSTITLNGTGGNTYTSSQIIGYNVELTGDANLNLIYDSCNGYISPPYIELHK